ncbi:aminotransferase class V-fold PLP-dependent enzyme [Caldalkalibacillus mannanilyticus]|uniref:aminotransferase class V-fold PLP-dependent enzyme n=1 Tax=Caldalkalibacillus mannanilyticus TaxID=1418 RepID=UPI000468F19A|nr:aminotransferase class V-fold PLP-dependent enzyme [Caldalkalibacillus mannanilyticus]
MGMIYFDNAASTWPKPEGVGEAMLEAVKEYGANPGRGGHQLSLKASRVVFQTRAALAKLFGIKDPTNIVFFSNATVALNQVIKGFRWQEGDHVISTTYEHNSVRRPLEFIHREYGVQVSYIEPDHNGHIPLDEVEKLIHSKTKLIVCTHVSNLTGSILPVTEIGHLAKQHQVPFLVDASQSAGSIPIHISEMNIDLLAFPGHKGLYGPQGTGGLYISPDIDLLPLVHGGTGSQSESIDQPTVRPDRYESGTVNTPGIAGWKAGLDFVMQEGIDTIWEHERSLTQYALQELKKIEQVIIYGPDEEVERAPVIPINIKGMDAQECSFILDQHFGIATRAGMHCTPLGHQAIQTIESGAVRISFGYFNTLEEIDQLIVAVKEISKSVATT